MPPDATYTPAGPWISTLPASPQCIPDTPYTPWWSKYPQCPYILGVPNAHIPLLAPEHLHSLPASQCTPDTPYSPWWPQHPYTCYHLLMPPWCPDTHAGFQLSSLCSWPSSWVCLVYNITSCFQLSSVCNWLSSWVHPVRNIPSSGVKSTSVVLWNSANFCNISQNMYSKTPVASQHWKTNKVVWTWKDDWPPRRTSTYERPFTREGNYLVFTIAFV